MNPAATETTGEATVIDLVARARIAQAAIDRYDQQATDDLVAAAAWAILEPARNRALAELAVTETGIGKVADKIAKNERKTLGLLRDLAGARSVGVIAEIPELGITEIARPVGVVAAITPSTNPAATPANNIINALKGRNAIILAPSPKGVGTCARLLEFVHTELARIGAPADLVQMLPPPADKLRTQHLMRHADLVVATGSAANVRAAYSSGTPALGVGVGNVAAIVSADADVESAAFRIAASKTFDNATSCSSENAVIVIADAIDRFLPALVRHGGVVADVDEKRQLQATMFPDGRLSPAVIGQEASRIAEMAALSPASFATARLIVVEAEADEVGPRFPFSGEKLSPVLTLYRVADFDAAIALVRRIYAFQGRGHSVGLHGNSDADARRLAEELPVCRVIVNQAHCFATGGAFDNGLPFSLSMGCGTWGGNSFSDNLGYRHFLNITRIARPIAARPADVESLLGPYWQRYGK